MTSGDQPGTKKLGESLAKRYFSSIVKSLPWMEGNTAKSVPPEGMDIKPSCKTF
jgi:hypothetical protein